MIPVYSVTSAVGSSPPGTCKHIKETGHALRTSVVLVTPFTFRFSFNFSFTKGVDLLLVLVLVKISICF